MVIRKIIKYNTLTASGRAIFREALWLSVRARFLTLFFTLKHYGHKLGDYRGESPEIITPRQEAIAEEVSESVRRVAKYVPWRCKCLEQAIIAKIMLNKRKMESTLYLGVSKKEEKMVAHAWVRYGNNIITGKRGYNKYTVVSSFA